MVVTLSLSLSKLLPLFVSFSLCLFNSCLVSFTHAPTHTHTHTCTHKYGHTRTHTCTHKYTHTRTPHTYTHTHSHMHSQIHPHAHTHALTNTHIYIKRSITLYADPQCPLSTTETNWPANVTETNTQCYVANCLGE